MKKPRPISHFKFTEEEYQDYLNGKEIWRDVEGYEGKYRISTFGKIKSLDRRIYPKTYPQYPSYVLKGRIMKAVVNETGYYILQLCDSGKIKNYSIHSLLGKHFLKNPENKPCINHKNGIKIDIELSNLEWATYSENSIHAFETGLQIPNMRGKTGKLCKYSKPIKQLTLDGKLIKVHYAVRDAARETGIDHSYISACARGKHKSARGFKWEYV
jgi:hypothetical protein